MKINTADEILNALATKTRDGTVTWSAAQDRSVRVNFPRSSIEIIPNAQGDSATLIVYNSEGVLADEFRPRNSAMADRLTALYEIAIDTAVMRSITLNDIRENLGLGRRLNLPVELKRLVLDRTTLPRGGQSLMKYYIHCAKPISPGICLSANFGEPRVSLYFNSREDRPIELRSGLNVCDRTIIIPRDAPLGEHPLRADLWDGSAKAREEASFITTLTTSIFITDK